MIFFHIGGGAGDLNPSTNFRDGFSEFVKSHKSRNKNIFIIEANPVNINKLKKTWKKYRSVKIFNIAISAKTKKELKFFYSEKDAPHYLLFSNDINHIKRHFPESKIKSKFIKAITINKFLDENFNNKFIDYFSIDIEGSDFDVIMSLNFKKFKIKNISLEYLHLTKIQKTKILKKLLDNGYSYYGFGIDHMKIDWLFKKKSNWWNDKISKLLPIIHRKHYKRLNKLLIKNSEI
jgi:FkbM family methyltransferase